MLRGGVCRTKRAGEDIPWNDMQVADFQQVLRRFTEVRAKVLLDGVAMRKFFVCWLSSVVGARVLTSIKC
eukprot:4237756-Amphidinium_carterae.1